MPKNENLSESQAGRGISKKSLISPSSHDIDSETSEKSCEVPFIKGEGQLVVLKVYSIYSQINWISILLVMILHWGSLFNLEIDVEAF